MRFALSLLVLLCMGASLPAATTQPTTAPSTLPTPRQLLERFRQMKQEEAQRPDVAVIRLNRPLAERGPDFTLFAEETLTIHSLLQTLEEAGTDEQIHAVLLTLSDVELNIAQAQEIRDALARISAAGKRTFVYADSYDTTTYLLASGASDVCMLSAGELHLPGISIETTFLKGTLDWIGVQADFIQIGEYKGASEQLTRSAASPELRGELNRLADGLYNGLVDDIAASRKLSRQAVLEAMDQGILQADEAQKADLVDHVVGSGGIRELISSKLDEELDFVSDYGRDAGEEPDLSSPFGLFALLMHRPTPTAGPQIALIYADGVITDGEGGEGIFGSAVGAYDIRRAFQIASEDQDIKAIVLRIDSPGGSAVASEAMWQAARRLAQEKPLVVSIGGMAASGGYYLACGGDTIFADPNAIVGSIGVVGGKLVTRDLFTKLGITTETYSRGNNAAIFSSTQPFTDAQRELITKWMTRTYQQFTERVMTTRAGKIKDIDQVARGRIFLARQAKDLGLVDHLGGLWAAIEHAAREADLEQGAYELRVVPAPKTLGDLLSGREPEVELSTPLAPLMPANPALRRNLLQQMTILHLMETHRVLLVSPCLFQVR